MVKVSEEWKKKYPDIDFDAIQLYRGAKEEAEKSPDRLPKSSGVVPKYILEKYPDLDTSKITLYSDKEEKPEEQVTPPEKTPEQKEVEEYYSKNLGIDTDVFNYLIDKYGIDKMATDYLSGLEDSLPGTLAKLVTDDFEPAQQPSSFSGALGRATGDITAMMATTVAAAETGPFAPVIGALVPPILNSGLKEYMKYQRLGGKKDFGDFVDAAKDTFIEGGTEGAQNLMFMSLSKLMNGIKAVPSLSGLYDKLSKTKFIGRAAKPAAEAAKTGATAGAVSIIEAATRGELPSKDDIVGNIITALGIHAAMVPAGMYKKFESAYENKPRGTPINEFLKSNDVQALVKDLNEMNVRTVPADISQSALAALQEMTPKESDVGFRPTKPVGEGRPIEKAERIEKPSKAPKRIESAQKAISELPEKPSEELAGRVKHKPSKKDYRVQELGKKFSKKKPTSDYDTSEDITKNLKQYKQIEYTKVNEEYNKAKKYAAKFSGNFIESSAQARETLNELGKSKIPSPGEETVKKLLRKYIKTANKGYANVESMMKTADSLSSIMKYDTTTPDIRNRLAPTVKAINSDCCRAIKEKGGDPSILQKANENYKDHINRFSNTFIRDFSKKEPNVSYEKLYKKAKTPEGYRALNEIFEKSHLIENEKGKVIKYDYGPDLMRKITRDVVEDNLGKYAEDPKTIGSRAYEKDLLNLRSVVGEEATDKADKYLRNIHNEYVKSPKRFEKMSAQQRADERNAKKLTPQQRKDLQIPKQEPQYTAIESISRSYGKVTPKRALQKWETASKAAAKYQGKTPKEIDNMMNSVHGIRTLKADLSERPNGQRIMKDLTTRELNKIMSDGKINVNSTGKDIYNVINKSKNFETIQELLGPEQAKELLEVTKELGDKKLTKENLKLIGKKAMKYLGLSWALGIPIALH